MRNMQGIITDKSEKKWNGISLYSFKIEEDDTWYKTGQVDISQEVTEFVSFQERNGRVDVSTVSDKEFVDAPQSTAPSASVSDTVPAYKGDVIHKRIQWQNARADACRMVCAALAVEGIVEDGVLPWPKNLAKAKRLDHLMGYVNEITKQFIEEEEA